MPDVQSYAAMDRYRRSTSGGEPLIGNQATIKRKVSRCSHCNVLECRTVIVGAFLVCPIEAGDIARWKTTHAFVAQVHNIQLAAISQIDVGQPIPITAKFGMPLETAVCRQHFHVTATRCEQV